MITVTVANYQSWPPIWAGQKVAVKYARKSWPKRIKPREMIARMKGEKFKAKFIVTHVEGNTIQMKPLNF